MFPNYKKKLWWKVPDGWEDRGNANQDISCDTCVQYGNIRIGREDGKAFRFCKRCLVKL